MPSTAPKTIRTSYQELVYADEDASAAHRASEVHAAASPVFTELIAASDVTIGETLMAKGLGG